MAKVEIYTKSLCGYCARAKSVLGSKGVDFIEYDVSLGGPRWPEMLERSGDRRTVPQIFIDGRHIGGCDDMMALEAKGELDPMLQG